MCLELSSALIAHDPTTRTIVYFIDAKNNTQTRIMVAINRVKRLDRKSSKLVQTLMDLKSSLRPRAEALSQHSLVFIRKHFSPKETFFVYITIHFLNVNFTLDRKSLYNLSFVKNVRCPRPNNLIAVHGIRINLKT